jgi:hypothetical protein
LTPAGAVRERGPFFFISNRARLRGSGNRAGRGCLFSPPLSRRA